MISAMGSAMIGEDIDAAKKSAAKCVLESLSVKFPDETKAVVAKCGYAVPKDLKMSSEKVEAMLHDASVSRGNSRALFRHLEQFFGCSFFASEHARRRDFSGQDFPPTTKVHELKDKTKVQYWYKPPKEMLLHVVPHVLSKDDFIGIKSVDYTVGGDHGKGCFRMI